MIPLNRIKRNTQMGKVKKSYSERIGAPIGALRFLFDGRRVNDEETPKSLEMVEVKSHSEGPFLEPGVTRDLFSFHVGRRD
jgi:hypothetical protein